MIGMIGQRAPDIRHPLNPFGHLDVVEDGFHLASGLGFVDEFHQSHKSPSHMAIAECGLRNCRYTIVRQVFLALPQPEGIEVKVLYAERAVPFLPGKHYEELSVGCAKMDGE